MKYNVRKIDLHVDQLLWFVCLTSIDVFNAFDIRIFISFCGFHSRLDRAAYLFQRFPYTAHELIENISSVLPFRMERMCAAGARARVCVYIHQYL